MSVAYNPKIVTNGLVLALDAANPKSYPGTGTTWFNLVGTNNGTLTNGPTFNSSNNGTIVFDGSNDFVSETTVLSNSFWQGNWTANFWVNFDTLNTTTGTSDKTLVQHGSPSIRSGLHLTQRNSRIWFGLFGDDIEGGSTILSTGRWYFVSFILNNTSRLKQIYLNGIVDGSNTGAGAYIGSGNNTRIGGVVLNFGSYFDGFMGLCSFYNRDLTAAEIQQNFNATRGRYGV
jgi:hypothetical protein